MICLFLFFKQKTAYEMRISDWSSDVCSSDLPRPAPECIFIRHRRGRRKKAHRRRGRMPERDAPPINDVAATEAQDRASITAWMEANIGGNIRRIEKLRRWRPMWRVDFTQDGRSEEHTSELQSLMRISYAVFCLK